MIHALALQGNLLAPDATAVVVFVTALVMVGVLNRLLFKPVNQVLDERERRTRGYQSEAKAILAECEHKLSYYEDVIRQARAEGYQMLEQKRREALEKRDHLVGETKREMATSVEQARQTLSEQMTDAKRRLEADAEQVARDITASVLGRRPEGMTKILP
jgi:F-type H+-transporting ATPase subunit b